MSPRPPSAFVIGITTFDEQGKLDENAYRVHCRRMAAAGVGFYAGGSSPGEQYSMTPGEGERILQIAVEELKGKVPVRAMGVEPRNAKQMLEFLEIAGASGVEATQIYSLDLGHGNKPTDGEMEKYFRTCLEATVIPAVLSSHQSMGYFVPAEMMKRLTDDYPHLVGIHATSPDIGYLVKILELLPDRVSVHVGGEMHAITALAMGASGFLSSQGNIAPKLCQSVINYWQAGDYPRAFEAYHRINRLLFRPVSGGAAVRWTKATLKVLGLPGMHLRDPQIPVNEAETATIAKHLEKLDIRRIEGL